MTAPDAIDDPGTTLALSDKVSAAFPRVAEFMLDAPHVDDDELFSPLISLVLDGIGARLANAKTSGRPSPRRFARVSRRRPRPRRRARVAPS